MKSLAGLTYVDGWSDCVKKILHAVELGLDYKQAVECAKTAMIKTEMELSNV